MEMQFVSCFEGPGRAHLAPTQPHDIGDAAKRVHVRLGEEGHSNAMTAGPASSSDAMNVRDGALREIVIDNHVDALKRDRHENVECHDMLIALRRIALPIFFLFLWIWINAGAMSRAERHNILTRASMIGKYEIIMPGDKNENFILFYLTSTRDVLPLFPAYYLDGPAAW